jgi:basic membrane protein A
MQPTSRVSVRRLPRVLALLASVLLAVSALGAPLAAADQPAFKIGLILTGSATDGGWNQLAKDGLDRIKDGLHADVSVIQKVSGDKAGDVMREYAADHCDLIIAHGYEYLNPAVEAAKGAGACKIAVSGADVAKPGIATVDFDLSQASYLMGIAAARVSRTGKLGFIGGEKYPSVTACYRGFLAGAKSVRADATVAEAYTSWDQPALSKSQAEAFFGQGIDVVFHDVDSASRGIFEAVQEHNAAAKTAQDAASKTPVDKVWAIGSCADQNANQACADAMIGSAVIRLDHAFERLALAVKAGKFPEGVQTENLASGTCVAVLNPAQIGKGIPATVADELTAAQAKLIAGTITIPPAAP